MIEPGDEGGRSRPEIVLVWRQLAEHLHERLAGLLEPPGTSERGREPHLDGELSLLRIVVWQQS